MFSKVLVWLLIVVGACGLLVNQVTAQTAGSPYIVTAGQAINARQCPRLDCAVVRSLAPQTVVNVVGLVSGDTVAGSDQWVQIDDAGVQMYAHSSLVAPNDDEPVALEQAEESAQADTANWTNYTVDTFDLLAPRTWIDIVELATDEDYLAGVEEMYGKGERQWYLDTYAGVQDGSYDLVLVEINSAGVLFLSHTEWGMEVSPRYLREVMETYMEAGEGGKLISSEIVELSAGNAVRIVMDFTNVSGSTSGQFTYGIIVDDCVYYLDVILFGVGTNEYYANIADVIANSFNYRTSDL